MTLSNRRVLVEYEVELTRGELHHLTLAAASHYDAVCREVARTGWLTTATRRACLGLAVTVYFGWRDLDVLSKIAESPLVPLELARQVWDLFQQLRNDTYTLNTTLGE
ncbi:MAG: hypothetical protein ABFD60_01480 [Bryobacteraceae bacterium]